MISWTILPLVKDDPLNHTKQGNELRLIALDEFYLGTSTVAG
ncbi:MAG: hypothetical protein QOH71_4303 [Blastocatellia bacterium]|nr:hypothetical protein [Blastocatellia bacterium]